MKNIIKYIISINFHLPPSISARFNTVLLLKSRMCRVYTVGINYAFVRRSGCNIFMAGSPQL